MNDFIEKLADLEHEIWAGWAQRELDQILQELIANGENRAADIINNLSCVQRWRKQIITPYENLSEKEKQSDRKQVYKRLPVYVPEAWDEVMKLRDYIDRHEI